MKLNQCILLCLAFVLFQAWPNQGCENIKQPSGVISFSRGYSTPRYNYYSTPRYDYYSTPRYDYYTAERYYTRNYFSTLQYDFSKCWYIVLPKWPEDSYLKLNLLEYRLDDPYCDATFLEVELESFTKKYKICDYYYHNSNNWNKTMKSNVIISINFRSSRYQAASFKMQYHIESVACIRKDNFRCSENHCISSKKVCDGEEDCKDGSDEHECGPLAIAGIKESREESINWLKKHQASFGWGRNTHRAITALYLTGEAMFRGSDIEEEAIVKELELKLATSLLRNTTNPLSVNEISMYVNALSVTCHDIRKMFGKDLLKLLANQALSARFPSPGAYLTLCNANWKLSSSDVRRLLNVLSEDSEYSFVFEIQAMTIMALSCIREKTDLLHNLDNGTRIFNQTIENFAKFQKADGSFGNAHTTAMVTQALFASGRAESKMWSSEGALQFLMTSLNSSADFLSVYLSLPLFRGKTLLDIGSVDCSQFQRRSGEDDDILDVMDKLDGNAHVQLSLYIGDHKDVIHTIYLRVPDNSTFLDVMKVGRIADPKYKFSYHMLGDYVYVYEIAGITNDMEAGKYWQFFAIDPDQKTHLKKFTASPNEIMTGNKEHLIIWYKSVDI